MGNISKARAKANKAKNKIAAKCGKCSKGKRRSAVAIAALCAGLLYGCATSDSAQPAKSQTQNNTFDDCVIIIATTASISNRVVRADGSKEAPAAEIFTQTQSLESSGSESYAQTATQTPTVDVRTKIDARYNDAMAAASSTSKNVLDALTDWGKEAVLNMMANKASGTVEVEKKDGTKATVECKDGQCEFVDSGCKDCQDK